MICIEKNMDYTDCKDCKVSPLTIHASPSRLNRWSFTLHALRFTNSHFSITLHPLKNITMADKKIIVTAKTPTASTSTLRGKEAVAKKQRLPLFEKDNYMWMGIGAVVIAIGMILMAGGKNENPNQFDYKLVYSTTRITIAPILILAGLVIEIFAIFKRPKVHG